MPKNRIEVRINGDIAAADRDAIRDRIVASAFKDFDFSVIDSDGDIVTVEYDDADIAFIEQFHAGHR